MNFTRKQFAGASLAVGSLFRYLWEMSGLLLHQTQQTLCPFKEFDTELVSYSLLHSFHNGNNSEQETAHALLGKRDFPEFWYFQLQSPQLFLLVSLIKNTLQIHSTTVCVEEREQIQQQYAGCWRVQVNFWDTPCLAPQGLVCGEATNFQWGLSTLGLDSSSSLDCILLFWTPAPYNVLKSLPTCEVIWADSGKITFFSSCWFSHVMVSTTERKGRRRAALTALSSILSRLLVLCVS